MFGTQRMTSASEFVISKSLDCIPGPCDSMAPREICDNVDNNSSAIFNGKDKVIASSSFPVEPAKNPCCILTCHTNVLIQCFVTRTSAFWTSFVCVL